MIRSDSIQVFDTLCAFNGDVPRAAIALNLTQAEVRGMLISNNWAPMIAERNKLREGSTQDESIVVNRAINYVQAHRLRGLVDRVASELNKLEPDALVDLLSSKSKGKNGEVSRTFSARALTDLVKAAESCHLMTQRALGDTPTEHTAPEGKAGSSIALLVQQAMTAADCLGVSSVEVVREQLRLPDVPDQSRQA